MKTFSCSSVITAESGHRVNSDKKVRNIDGGPTEVVEDAGLLVTDVVMSDCFSREDFSPATPKNTQ